MRFAASILPLIDVAIDKILDPMAPLEEALELALIETILVLEDPLSMLPIVLPVPLVEVALGRRPYPIAILAPLGPSTLEVLAIVPGECAQSLSLVV